MSQLDSYRVVQLVTENCMYEIYLIEKIRNSKLYIMKKLKYQIETALELIEINEVKCLLNLDCENLPKIKKLIVE